MTCYHVVEGAKEIYVRIDCDNDNREVKRAEIFGFDKENDYAVLNLSDTDKSCFYKLETDYSTIKTGDDVCVFGFPFGSELNENVMELEPSLTKGYIASKNKIDGKVVYFLDVRSAPGNSGGPVFCQKTGNVIGYLCGSYGNDRADIIYIRTLEAFFDSLCKD